jgi:hypothetical protein
MAEAAPAAYRSSVACGARLTIRRAGRGSVTLAPTSSRTTISALAATAASIANAKAATRSA